MLNCDEDNVLRCIDQAVKEVLVPLESLFVRDTGLVAPSGRPQLFSILSCTTSLIGNPSLRSNRTVLPCVYVVGTLLAIEATPYTTQA